MLDATTAHPAPFSRDSVQYNDIVGFRIGCEDAGDMETALLCDRALDQYIEYRDYANPEQSVDTDALDDVCAKMNAATAVIDAAFRSAELTIEVLQKQVESYTGRRDWKHCVLESI